MAVLLGEAAPRRRRGERPAEPAPPMREALLIAEPPTILEPHHPLFDEPAIYDDPQSVYLSAKHHTAVNMDLWRWPDFSPAEMASRDSGLVYVNEDLMDLLQGLRDQLGVPLRITSGYRTPRHNTRVGGASRSQHMLGRAADIVVDNVDPAELIGLAQDLGATGVGRYPRQNFVHLDVRVGAAADWGPPFPPRPDSRFAEDPDGREAAAVESATRTVTATGGAGAAMAGGAGAAIEAQGWGWSVADIIQIASLGVITATAIGLAYVAARNWSRITLWLSDMYAWARGRETQP